MSGIYIMDIEMPEVGQVDMEVIKYHDKYFIGPRGKSNWFQLIPVPDHGPLIDADELTSDLIYPSAAFKQGFEAIINDCRTIIPADKEEIQ